MNKNRFLLLNSALLAISISMTGSVFAANSSATTSNSTAATQSTSITEIKHAAKAGDPDAQYALGYMYYYGKGVEQNINLAKECIKKAAAQGQQQAVQANKILFDAGLLNKSNTAATASQHTHTAQTQKTQQTASSKITTATSTSAATQNTASAAAEAAQSVQASARPYFSLQLMGSHRKSDVTRFIKKANLGTSARVYHTDYKGKNWYVLVYGKYSSRKAAQSAISSLPALARNQHPWVKSSALIKKEINRRQHS